MVVCAETTITKMVAIEIVLAAIMVALAGIEIVLAAIMVALVGIEIAQAAITVALAAAMEIATVIMRAVLDC